MLEIVLGLDLELGLGLASLGPHQYPHFTRQNTVLYALTQRMRVQR